MPTKLTTSDRSLLITVTVIRAIIITFVACVIWHKERFSDIVFIMNQLLGE